MYATLISFYINFICNIKKIQISNEIIIDLKVNVFKQISYLFLICLFIVFQFLHYKLDFIFINYNLLLFLILIYCNLLYVCALELVNL